MENFGEQPEVVPFGFRVLRQYEEMTTDQQRLIAFAFGELEVAAVAGYVFCSLGMGCYGLCFDAPYKDIARVTSVFTCPSFHYAAGRL